MAMFHMATSKLKDGQITQAIEDFKASEAIEYQHAEKAAATQSDHIY